MNPPLDLIFGRRSVRAFRPGPITDDQTRTLLEAAMAAPSAVAKDPWRFIVVRDPVTLDHLGAVLSNGYMLPQAGLGVVVCGDLEAAHDRQLSYLLQDCAAATENLLLATHGLGLGACWLGIHPRETRIQEVRQILEIPHPVLPVACIAVGHPAETKDPRTRYQPSFVHHERWSTPPTRSH
jgi:nitroreductase